MMTEQIWGHLKAEKVSLGVAIGMVWVCFISYQWVFETFVTKAEAATNVQHIEQKLDRNTTLLQDHIEEYRIGEAIKDVEAVDADIWHLKMHEVTSGATPETKALMRELEERKRHAVDYRECLLDNRPNCQHLNRR